ncbi:unnamed protein product [Cylicostephanus goldi]|uniref:Uncharacterized protein n=1 Tax=Cylicostephanus goldi TaxID=71465 RepID=A0A3P6TA50_CYLGO|nr:unnamed protein product [Cylicostephanus goldi]
MLILFSAMTHGGVDFGVVDGWDAASRNRSTKRQKAMRQKPSKQTKLIAVITAITGTEPVNEQLWYGKHQSRQKKILRKLQKIPA